MAYNVPMSDANAFLDAVLAEPDDVSCRLIFADWLEERGDPRGEFIRIQCALAGNHLDELQRARFTIRQQALLAQHEAEWSAPFQGAAGGWTFRRGFIEDVIFDAEAFLEKAAGLFQVAPVRHVALKRIGTMMVDVAEHPALRMLEGLVLRGNNMGDTGAEILAREARFSRLLHLDLGMNFIEIAGARALAASPYLGKLTTLLIEQNPIQDMGAYAIASSPYLTRLECLNLAYCQITEGGARYLADSSVLGNLRTLNLNSNELGDVGVRALARSRALTQLTSLSLRSNGFGVSAARALADATNLRWLTHLDVGDNAVHGRQREILQMRFGDACRF